MVKLQGQGRWVKCETKTDDGHGYYWYECSECGGVPLCNLFNHERVLSDFCPWCGAKLEPPEVNDNE